MKSSVSPENKYTMKIKCRRTCHAKYAFQICLDEGKREWKWRSRKLYTIQIWTGDSFFHLIPSSKQTHGISFVTSDKQDALIFKSGKWKIWKCIIYPISFSIKHRLKQFVTNDDISGGVPEYSNYMWFAEQKNESLMTTSALQKLDQRVNWWSGHLGPIWFDHLV